MRMIILVMAGGSLLILGGIFLVLGFERPIKDISGCYTAKENDIEDIFCIVPPDSYYQYYVSANGIRLEYNSGHLSIFNYTYDYWTSQAATIDAFEVIDQRGRKIRNASFDITPLGENFGPVTFKLDADLAGHEREYIRSNLSAVEEAFGDDTTTEAVQKRPGSL